MSLLFVEAPPEMEGVEHIPVGLIKVGENRRALVPEKVEAIRTSISQIGLRTPLTVWRAGSAWDKVGVATAFGDPTLVAGHHRLAAVRALAWETVPCTVVHDGRTARMWEIAENLHRAELTELERSDHIEEWRRLTFEKVRQVDAPISEGDLVGVGSPAGGKQPAEAGIRKTAEALAIPEVDVRRAKAIASLPEEAKEAARETGLDDNQSALLAATKSEKPAEAIRQIAAEKEEKKKAKKRPADKQPESAAPAAPGAGVEAKAEVEAEAVKVAEPRAGRRLSAVAEWLELRIPADEVPELVELMRGMRDPLSALADELEQGVVR